MSVETFLQLLELPPVQRGLLALALGAIGLPIIGVVIIGLDIMPVRFAMMHVALLGIAVGMLLGLDPLLCALVACAASGAALTPLARSPSGLSGAMGLLMSLAIAAALLVLSVSGVNANGAFELLWGSILATRTGDVVLLGTLAVLIPGLFLLRRRQLALLLHDRELAACSGVRVDRLTLVLLLLVAVSVAGAIRLTGALLVDALTLLPALAARRLASSLRGMVLAAVIVGLLVNLAGFLLALALDFPPGPVLVLLAGAVALAVHLLPDWRKHRWASSRGQNVAPASSH
ncbi:metal ABC transporter permease [Amycolatopsis cihanbeyliensis]|uniref:Zinc transport system permease protein n=1 Tax=Amycolatopsis cihanbeyliensis TaxID=1128664 RepID=A0A542DEB1_AMYCI|nr:metal ABC transporter permease [Amycolatopsis cihanbeyliensis]TQJ01411.1 zinc transport system permease protein [Amycolatopsis cihanbeyliensis]